MTKSRQLCCLLGLLVLIISTGCLVVAAGAVAGGGYAAAKYQVSGDVRGSYGHVWATAASVLRSRGEGVSLNGKKGSMKGTVDGSDILILVKKKSPDRTTVRIRARKGVRPNEKLAQQIFARIRERV